MTFPASPHLSKSPTRFVLSARGSRRLTLEQSMLRRKSHLRRHPPASPSHHITK
ncbi:hypothetical protein IMZ48_13105 [Candidatus Bathyarchaeota archaeon]|nr:hypothetical protein [Candidatus Bathyarchaeota archaeon]